MIRFTLTTAALAVALVGCVEGGGAEDGFVRVTDPTAFGAAVVGRDLVASNDPSRVFRLNPDGSMGGDYGRGALAGSWSFEDGFWCRTWTAGLKPESPNARDCQTVEVAPGRIRLTRDRGAGGSGVFAIR